MRASTFLAMRLLMLSALMFAASETASAQLDSSVRPPVNLQTPAQQYDDVRAAVARNVTDDSFQLVLDKHERATAMAGFQRRVRSLGIPATFDRCDVTGLMAGLSVDSHRAYGGVCMVRIGTKPRLGYVVCDDNMGGVSLTQPEFLPIDPSEFEAIMRRICV